MRELADRRVDPAKPCHPTVFRFHAADCGTLTFLYPRPLAGVA